MPIVRFSLLTFAAAFIAPLAAHAAWWISHDDAVAWHRADWSSARILPPARAKQGAAVYVFAARTGRWKGIFAHHSWIVIKERGAANYTRFDKVAWGRPVKINSWGPPMPRWYGHAPMLVAAVEGPDAEKLVPKIKAAVARYPLSQPGDYLVWPGPNSNSFIAYVLAAVPEAGVVLPPTAIGKDWRVDSQIFGLAPSGTGVQLSLGGLFGVTIAWIEGLELNVLGLVAGLDIRRPAIKLPGFGRIGMSTA
ncbi:MAG: DUF3750 domain-containing protein [Rhodospirillales bacterium]|nr:DUF3750 domain-containing protein [Rhodospirillales bacterium]